VGLKVQFPVQRNILRDVADAIVAGLITEGALDGDVAIRIEQGLQGFHGRDGHLTLQAERRIVDERRFFDCFEAKFLRGRILHGVRLPGGRFFEFPFNGDIAFDAGRVDVHFGFRCDVDDQTDVFAAADNGVA